MSPERVTEMQTMWSHQPDTNFVAENFEAGVDYFLAA
jgi:hypothetical protein